VTNYSAFATEVNSVRQKAKKLPKLANCWPGYGTALLNPTVSGEPAWHSHA
jgi:hypothetical protein